MSALRKTWSAATSEAARRADREEAELMRRWTTFPEGDAPEPWRTVAETSVLRAEAVLAWGFRRWGQ